jgi:uncharacterized protein (TIGR03086 family)
MDVSQLKAAQDHVVAALRWAEEDQWTEQTPCPEWDVRALVDHLITGNERFVVRLAGEQPGPAPDRSASTTKELVEAYEQTCVEVLEAFARPAVMQGVSQWPIGALSGSDALGLKIAETLVHGWDLQQALGTTIDFDETTIDDAYAWSEPMLGRIPEGRNPFGTPQDCAPDAPPLDRLAALLGRAQTTVS